jgi:ferredoxin
MVKFHIRYEKEKCIGCGACAQTCPENWELVEENGEMKAKVKQTELEEVGCNQEAADGCPVECIHVEPVSSE